MQSFFLTNRLPSLIVLERKSPYQLLYGLNPPDLQLVIVFWMLVLSNLQGLASYKLSPRPLLYVYLGISDKHKVCFYSQTGKVFISRHVTFVEYILISCLSKFSQTNSSDFQMFQDFLANPPLLGAILQLLKSL